MARRAKNSWYLGLPALIGVIFVVILFVLQPPYGTPGLTRAAALLGYIALFVATVSSAYLRELVRFFGRSFIKVHHVVSIAAWVLLVLHPIGAVAAYASPGVLLPQFSSWAQFLTWAGPPAWYLLIIATAAALWRTKFRGWRSVHALNYLVFLLATVHGILLGTDGQLWGVRLVMILMALAVVAVFVRKRTKVRRKPAR